MEKSDQKKASCCGSDNQGKASCLVEALISVDDRGQMVLPKDLRDKAGIKAGDKLAIVSWVKDGDVCCISLIKAEYLSERVTEFLSPVMSGLSAGGQK